MDTTRIKKLAREQGVSLTHLCSMIGRKVYYLNDLSKKADSRMSEEDLRTIAIALNTTPEYLLGQTDDREFHLSSVGMETAPAVPAGLRPIIGRASAGLGVIAAEEILGYATVDAHYNVDDCFWLKVSGNSMSPLINDGDLVLVEKGCPVETGTIMVIVVDDTEGLVKRVYVNEDTVTLASVNPDYPPRVFGGAEIGRLRMVGRVRELKREF